MVEKEIEEAERLIKKFGSRAVEAAEELQRVDADSWFYKNVKHRILELENISHRKFVNNLWKTHNEK